MIQGRGRVSGSVLDLPLQLRGKKSHRRVVMKKVVTCPAKSERAVAEEDVLARGGHQSGNQESEDHHRPEVRSSSFLRSGQDQFEHRG